MSNKDENLNEKNNKLLLISAVYAFCLMLLTWVLRCKNFGYGGLDFSDWIDLISDIWPWALLYMAIIFLIWLAGKTLQFNIRNALLILPAILLVLDFGICLISLLANKFGNCFDIWLSNIILY